jgi:hypothetical protein
MTSTNDRMMIPRGARRAYKDARRSSLTVTGPMVCVDLSAEFFSESNDGFTYGAQAEPRGGRAEVRRMAIREVTDSVQGGTGATSPPFWRSEPLRRVL